MRRGWILAFLAVAAGGALPPAALAVGEPENTSPPQVSGQPVVGGTLTTSQGEWSSPLLPITGYAYQWVRCTPDCAEIAGASSDSYTVTEVDRGTTIKSRVTATNTVGSSSAESAAVGPVTGGSGVLAPAPTWSRRRT